MCVGLASEDLDKLSDGRTEFGVKRKDHFVVTFRNHHISCMLGLVLYLLKSTRSRSAILPISAPARLPAFIL